MTFQTLDELYLFAEKTDSGRAAFSDLSGRALTSPDFVRDLRQIAGGLTQLGLESGKGVAVLGLNSIETLQIILAAPLANLIPVPLNLRWAAAEIAFALDDADVAVVALDDPFLPLAAELAKNRPELIFVHIGQGETPAGMQSVNDLRAEPVELNNERDPAAPAIILYTGGTTGRSKGVVHSHASLVAGAMVMAVAGFPSTGKTYSSCFPFFHVAGIQPTLTRLIQNSTQLLMPMFRPDFVAAAVRDHGVQELGLAPTMMQMLITDPEFSCKNFAGLERLMYGSSPISAGLLAGLKETFPGVTYTQAYGMTEAGIVIFLGPQFHSGEFERIDGAGQPGAPGTKVRIEDNNGVALPQGQVGEIVVYGPTVMSGYRNRPSETDAALRKGGYRTGDLGMLDDMGVLYVRDRLKDMIITGGENVYSSEVESAISTLPGVAMVAVIGLPDEKWGERVHAVIVPKETHTLTLEEVNSYLKDRIAGYKHPRSLSLVKELPLSPMNKVLKHELRAQLTGD
ncbi:class I adenylate-forming enzyme family protein [Marinobacter sp. KMM 10035]|uniref:class I adenylate-forming enzyme family protein n=1 Tax=Marinobacter sp. KMM 10035 TaxID=3134034 RepID=UPI00397E103F